jgi:hypothetical protein
MSDSNINDSHSSSLKKLSELKVKYDALVSKRNDVNEQAMPKKERRAELLKGKLEASLTTEERVELQWLDDESNAEDIKNKGIIASESKKERELNILTHKYDINIRKYENEIEVLKEKLESIKNKYENDVSFIKEKADNTTEFYTEQAEKMIKRAESLYKTKKSVTERKTGLLAIEKKFADTSKTPGELTVDRDVQKILHLMQDEIRIMTMNKKSHNNNPYRVKFCGGIFEGVIPSLPEPIKYKKKVKVEVKVEEEEEDEEEEEEEKEDNRKPCPCGAYCPEVPEKEGSKYMIFRCLWNEDTMRNFRDEALRQDAEAVRNEDNRLAELRDNAMKERQNARDAEDTARDAKQAKRTPMQIAVEECRAAVRARKASDELSSAAASIKDDSSVDEEQHKKDIEDAKARQKLAQAKPQGLPPPLTLARPLSEKKEVKVAGFMPAKKYQTPVED